MVRWKFWQRSAVPARVLKLRPRGENRGSRRVDFARLAPDVATFLGQAAYLQLGYFETLTRLIRATENLPEKEALSLAAGAALRKHRAIVAVISDRGDSASEVMLPFQTQLDDFRARTIGANPRETMLSVVITAGILDDFYLALSGSYGDAGRRVARVLRADNDRDQIVERLRSVIEDDEAWRDLLSMWARRLVGDTLLVARAALVLDGAALVADESSPDAASETERAVEPVYTALMAAHAERMGSLGLAA